MSKPILVLSANSKVGAEAVHILSGAGHAVRAAVRDASEARALDVLGVDDEHRCQSTGAKLPCLLPLL